jgi:hypothetical protein
VKAVSLETRRHDHDEVILTTSEKQPASLAELPLQQLPAAAGGAPT